MKKSLLVLIFIGITFFGRTQSFEGVLTYSVEFEFKEGFVEMREQILDKLKKDGDYYDTIKIFIEHNKYKKLDNSRNTKSIIYVPEQNTIYTLTKGFDYAFLIDASKRAWLDLNLPEPNIGFVDSIKYVSNIECGLLKLSWKGLGEELYFFNKSVASIDPELFKNHNYEYLNAVLNSTGSYPLEIVKSLDHMMSIKMSLISIEEKELSDKLFEIPRLKKASKRMNEMPPGIQVMKIRN